MANPAKKIPQNNEIDFNAAKNKLEDNDEGGVTESEPANIELQYRRELKAGQNKARTEKDLAGQYAAGAPMNVSEGMAGGSVTGESMMPQSQPGQSAEEDEEKEEGQKQPDGQSPDQNQQQEQEEGQTGQDGEQQAKGKQPGQQQDGGQQAGQPAQSGGGDKSQQPNANLAAQEAQQQEAQNQRLLFLQQRQAAIKQQSEAGQTAVAAGQSGKEGSDKYKRIQNFLDMFKVITGGLGSVGELFFSVWAFLATAHLEWLYSSFINTKYKIPVYKKILVLIIDLFIFFVIMFIIVLVSIIAYAYMNPLEVLWNYTGISWELIKMYVGGAE